jgi:tubby-related protein 1
MQNRKPSWNESIKGYMLYFGGRVKKASIKNFILEDEDHPETARLIFGKLD